MQTPAQKSGRADPVGRRLGGEEVRLTQPSNDPRAVNRFAMQVLQDWGGAHISALAYIGDRLGLFAALAESGPVTSAGRMP